MVITLKLSEDTIKKMDEFYKDSKRDKTPQYAKFQADSEDTVVTAYESGKVVFQGVSADIDSNIWKEMELHNHPDAHPETKKKDKEKKQDVYNKRISITSTIGSDEVGTGDYFGPIVVTASYVEPKDFEFLNNLGVRDSKKLDDAKIASIVPEIIKRIPYTTLKLSNQEYNAQVNKGYNMNQIKAIMHNKVLTELHTKYNPEFTVVDQFCLPVLYFKYLKEATNVWRKIEFTPRAEDKVLSVACSSIISRYIFLTEMKKMSKELDINIPLGASDEVNKAAEEVVEKYGQDKLKEVVKLNFKNTQKVVK
jgi:ribonuclease HIII